MNSKSQRNQNKTVRGDFDCTMDKMARGGGIKTQRLYICDSNYSNYWRISCIIIQTPLAIFSFKETTVLIY